MNGRTHPRSWILGIHGRVAGVALALAIVLAPAVLATRSAHAQTLYSFTGGADGGNPEAGLVRDSRGNLYGTTYWGGDLACSYRCGTVFKLDTAGNKTVLYSFTGIAEDGRYPAAGLLRVQGNLYGTTVWGGASGNGTVFKLDRAGQETVLYSFTGGGGASPEGVLVRDAQGNLYGTTPGGGASGCGTVFKVDTTGQETVLYTFTCGPDGGWSYAGLVQDSQGNLYGTTYGGGASGVGTVFKVDTTGQETVLYCFGATGGEGANPGPGLVRDKQGNLYGTTVWGGAYDGGTVFKVGVTGQETVLYSFTGGGDGGKPLAGLVRDKQGSLYGTTYGGGAAGVGTVFMVDTTGNETVLHSFTGTGGDGAYPMAGVVLDAQGSLYGTTYLGGDLAACWGGGCGTVFEIQRTATTTTLSSSPNPSAYGQAVTFTAVVSSSLGAPRDGETVTFMDGGKRVLGTVALNGGSASVTTSTLWMGANAITAVYGGDSKFGGSTSKAGKQMVSKATTTTALVSSQNPSNSGQSVTFTASVMPEFSGTVKGALTFYDGTTVLKTKFLSGGVATFTTKTLTSGTHGIAATYNGSARFSGSSASLTQTVN